MTSNMKKSMRAGLLVAIGLSTLSPLSLASVTLIAAGSALWAAPASALGKIKGKIKVSGDTGLIVRRLSDDSLIVAPTDLDGAIYLASLAPGEYAVKLLGDSASTNTRVGPDGKLAFVALRDDTSGSNLEPIEPLARKVRREAKKAVREWVEPVEFSQARPDLVVDAKAAILDVNTADASGLLNGTNNSREAAAFIIAERNRAGPYKDPLDFAMRVGNSVTVDFGYSSTRMGNTTIIARGGDPKAAGFRTAVKSGVVELYGKKHPYVGHVTLLK